MYKNEKVRYIHETILSYNENIEKIGIMHKKLLIVIGWAQEARKNLLKELDIENK